MATIQYVSVPLLSLGSSTARLNPKLSTSPIARKINLVGQTKPIIRRDLQTYQIMNIRIKRTHRKRVLHRIDLQEHRGELCIENQREREEAI